MGKGKPQGRPGPRRAQVVVTKVVRFQGCNVTVDRLPDGGRVLDIVDPIGGTSYLLPLDPQSARNIGGQLSSAVEVHKEMPKANGDTSGKESQHG